MSSLVSFVSCLLFHSLSSVKSAARVNSSVRVESYVPSDTASQGSMAVSSNGGQVSTSREDGTTHSNLDQDASHYMGVDAVKNLRQSYILNKVRDK